jgi:hypothetical protein
VSVAAWQLIQDLKNKAMRPRHWDALKKEINKDFDPYSSTFTLEQASHPTFIVDVRPILGSTVTSVCHHYSLFLGCGTSDQRPTTTSALARSNDRFRHDHRLSDRRTKHD